MWEDLVNRQFLESVVLLVRGGTATKRKRGVQSNHPETASQRRHVRPHEYVLPHGTANAPKNFLGREYMAVCTCAL